MTHPARRFRRWVMAAGPGMILAGWRFGAPGAAAVLLVWMAAGALLPGISRLPYAPRRRLHPHRLFLGYAAGAALLCGITEAGKRLLPLSGAGFLFLLAGAVCFCLILCQQLLRLSLPRMVAWPVGAALCAAALAQSAPGGWMSLP